MAALGNVQAMQESAIAKRDQARKLRHHIWLIGIQIVAWGTVAVIAALLLTIIVKGLPAMSWGFLTEAPVDGMKAGGIAPQIRGSILLMFGTLLFVLPVGVLGGIFLAEYAGTRKFAQIMHACVISLAGTPSIIFGLFGLSVFVLGFHWNYCLLAGWFTLALFSLPTIVLTTETAIRAVPNTLVDGAIALGLSKWQTIWKVVLPNAMPGILSGLILTTGRAAGEAPPILLTAGIYYSSAKFTFGSDLLFKPVENLPYHLAESYRQGGVIPERITWGTCLCLLLFIVILNLGAILLRSRMRFKNQA